MRKNKDVLGITNILNQMIEQDIISSFKIEQKEKDIYIDLYVYPIIPLSSINIQL